MNNGIVGKAVVIEMSVCAACSASRQDEMIGGWDLRISFSSFKWYRIPLGSGR